MKAPLWSTINLQTTEVHGVYDITFCAVFSHQYHQIWVRNWPRKIVAKKNNSQVKHLPYKISFGITPFFLTKNSLDEVIQPAPGWCPRSGPRGCQGFDRPPSWSRSGNGHWSWFMGENVGSMDGMWRENTALSDFESFWGVWSSKTKLACPVWNVPSYKFGEQNQNELESPPTTQGIQ